MMKKLTFKEMNSLVQCYKLINSRNWGSSLDFPDYTKLKCLSIVVLESLYLGLNIGTTIYQTHDFRDVI